MHRQPIQRLFANYEARFPEEIDTVSRIRDFVNAHPDCFERTLAVGHVTGSAWLLDRSRSRVLLTHHRKLDIWVQLGGHADGETNIASVALREAVEESGLPSIRLLSPEIFDIDIHGIPARGAELQHFHYDCRFLLLAETAADFVVSEESRDLAWIELPRITEYTTEASVLRMRDKTHTFPDE